MIRPVILRFIILLCLLAQPVHAQVTRSEPVTMAWADLYPWFYPEAEGDVQGFAVALIEMIAAEAGFEIAPFEVETYADWGRVQADGTSQILPAVAPLPGLVGTNVFSESILTTEVRLAIPFEALGSFDPTSLAGTRVGVLSPGAGSDPALLPNATLVPYPNIDAAILGLLGGEVEALSAESSFVFAEAFRAKLDGRIVFVGSPLQKIERAIAIHESRADLLAPINAAVAKIKTDGRLDDLLSRHKVFPPDGPPDVLRVGVFNLEPYMAINRAGEATGFAVDVLRDVAAIAGLELEFVPIQMRGLVPGSTHDVVPVISITPERKELMDFSYPIESSEFSIFMRSDESEVRVLEDLGDRPTGVFAVSLAKRMAHQAGLENLVEYDDSTDIEMILRELSDGDIDAFLFENTSVRKILELEDLEDEIVEIHPPFQVTERAIGLRFGLGQVRQKLNAVLPGYVVSEEYAARRAQYFGEPVFWTRARILWVGGTGSFAILLMFISALVFQTRTLSRAVDAETAAADLNRFAASQGRELETIFNAATSGIVAVDLLGKVVRANLAARHMLGGISDPVPFEWPSPIRFLDTETMSPLDRSADPLRRALSGHRLHKETHLMRRVGSVENRRYVRIDSAQLTTDEGELIVLVIDDVSNEERNRQVVERKGRLDALGQLTGGIAHDFNNLLTSLLYSIVLARRSSDVVEREQHLEEAEDSINRGRALSSRLLAFASKQPGLAESRSVNRIFEDFQRLMRPMLEASIGLEIDMEHSDLIVFCDQTQLESALMNLVLNSRDAILRAGRGNRITLRARAVPAPPGNIEANVDDKTDEAKALRFVELSVTDNGPGMEEEVLARATDPFFTTKDSNSGTGLGLAMVYGFARQSSGDFRIYSEAEVGTTVQLTLPRGTSEGFREEPIDKLENMQGQGQTIMLVEDEIQILSAASKLIKSIGYDVITAKSGREALDMVEAGKEFDLLLTDVVMPGEIGGFELARRVRELRADVPVLYMSGYTGFTSSEMGDVIAPLLQKPTPPVELSWALSIALKAVE